MSAGTPCYFIGGPLDLTKRQMAQPLQTLYAINPFPLKKLEDKVSNTVPVEWLRRSVYRAQRSTVIGPLGPEEVILYIYMGREEDY